jgi:hypothetical protein
MHTCAASEIDQKSRMSLFYSPCEQKGHLAAPSHSSETACCASIGDHQGTLLSPTRSFLLCQVLKHSSNISSRLRKNSVYTENTVELFRMVFGTESPQDAQKGRPLRLWFVWFIWSLWFVWFIELVLFNRINETNQTDRTDQMNKTGWRTFSTSC